MESVEQSDGCQDGVHGSDKANIDETINVTTMTRPGRMVKPSAVIREIARGSGSSGSGDVTPVKRKQKTKSKKGKRTKFMCQTSSEDGGTSQDTSSQSSQDGQNSQVMTDSQSIDNRASDGTELNEVSDGMIETEGSEESQISDGIGSTNTNARRDASATKSVRTKGAKDRSVKI